MLKCVRILIYIYNAYVLKMLRFCVLVYIAMYDVYYPLSLLFVLLAVVGEKRRLVH
jgi:hypothetical protein